MNKRHRYDPYKLTVGIVTVILLVLIFSIPKLKVFNQFSKGTIIGDMDISGLTIEQAYPLYNSYSEKLLSKTIVVQNRDINLQIPLKNIGITTKNPNTYLKHIMGEQMTLAKKNPFKAILGTAVVQKDYSDLLEVNTHVVNSKFTKYLTESTSKYKDDYSVRNMDFNVDKLSDFLANLNVLDYVDNDRVIEIPSRCYTLSDDEARKQQAQNQKIGKAQELSLYVDKQKIVLDKDLVKKFIADPTFGKDNLEIMKIMDKLDLMLSTKIHGKGLKAQDGDFNWITNTDIGYVLNKEVTARAIHSAIAFGDFQANVVWKEEPDHKSAIIDLGSINNRLFYESDFYSDEYEHLIKTNVTDTADLYVEVDIRLQKLWVVRAGEVIKETDVVTGNETEGTPTPEGMYTIKSKTINTVLTGPDWRIPVNFWIPFHDGCGLHDAEWKSEFGGRLYKKIGSHGCVNIPADRTKEIYDLVKVGTPVIIHK